MPLPNYLTRANPHNIRDKTSLMLFQWELDTLAREAIMHCPLYGGKVPSWPQFANIINLLKKTEDEVFGLVEYDVFAELTRIAHRQFHWQQGVSHADITRFRRIYRQPGLDQLMHGRIGLHSEEYFLGAFALLATFMKHFAFTPAFAGNVTAALGFPVSPMIDRLSIDLHELREKSFEMRSLDIDWAYTFHPLRAHPLVKVPDGRTVCPLPGLLARRCTDGLYFDFASNPDDLSRHLGPAFQAYIGDVLATANDGKFNVQPEAKFGSAREPKRTVDWLVSDETATLFIECKVLRLAHAGKASLSPEKPMEQQLEKLAKAIAQTYTSLELALSGEYPNWKPNGCAVYPLIVTMDNWNLFTHVAHGALRDLITEELTRRGVRLKLLSDHPYTVCFTRELEHAIQVMHEVGIDRVLKGLTGDKFGYQVDAYLHATFKDELKRTRPLFPDEPQNLVARAVRSLRAS